MQMKPGDMRQFSFDLIEDPLLSRFLHMQHRNFLIVEIRPERLFSDRCFILLSSKIQQVSKDFVKKHSFDLLDSLK
jgi:hypothetical protein